MPVPSYLQRLKSCDRHVIKLVPSLVNSSATEIPLSGVSPEELEDVVPSEDVVTSSSSTSLLRVNDNFGWKKINSIEEGGTSKDILNLILIFHLLPI